MVLVWLLRKGGRSHTLVYWLIYLYTSLKLLVGCELSSNFHFISGMLAYQTLLFTTNHFFFVRWVLRYICNRNNRLPLSQCVSKNDSRAWCVVYSPGQWENQDPGLFHYLSKMQLQQKRLKDWLGHSSKWWETLAQILSPYQPEERIVLGSPTSWVSSLTREQKVIRWAAAPPHLLWHFLQEKS